MEFLTPRAQLAGVTVADADADADADAPALVLLHSLAMDHTLWTPPILTRLGASHRLIAFDLPGHGGSPIGASATIEDFADRVLEAASELGVSEFAVLGASLGGSVAQAVAARGKGRVRAAAFVDTTADYADPAGWAARAGRARNEGFAAMADFQRTRWFTQGFREQHADEVDRLLGIFVRMDLDAYERVCSAMGAMNLTAVLPRIACPVAVVVGAEDYATPPAHAQALADRLPNARLTVVDSASHLGVVERPDAYLDAVESVLTLA